LSTDLQGKTIVVTGASSGIGRAAAIEFAARGARVAVIGRNAERTGEVAAAASGVPFVADFASFDSVRSLAAELLQRFDRIDALANNAGGLVSKRVETEDGHEQTIQVNHLSPFLLTKLLLPRLLASASVRRPVRVVSTASVANRWGRLQLDDLDSRKRGWGGGWRAYGSAKIATILFTRELARRTLGTGIEAYAFHPGFVTTGFGADSPVMKLGAMFRNGGLGLTPEAGAVPLIELATSSTLRTPSGSYFDRLSPNGRRNKQASDETLAAELWALSDELTSPRQRAAA
jgi:NAD(P)-dependent dehydrogenase (short-subunit alcohol dehydrogenase family)